MNTLKTIKALDDLQNRLHEVLKEIDKIKATIADDSNLRVIPKDAKNITMEDLYNAIGKNRKSYIYRVKYYCRDNNIDTFEQFISITPKEFICKKGIGTSTFRVVKKAVENLGIAWIDNE